MRQKYSADKMQSELIYQHEDKCGGKGHCQGERRDIYRKARHFLTELKQLTPIKTHKLEAHSLVNHVNAPVNMLMLTLMRFRLLKLTFCLEI